MNGIDTFLGELSSAQPVPGGGSVAALQTAMGAALLVMVANLTIGRKKYQAVESQVVDIKDRAAVLCTAAQRLVQEDIDAYQRVADVLSMPRETEEQKVQRSLRMQEALKAAVQPPLETMRVASQIAGLAEQLVEVGNVSAISDVGTAVLASRAGFHAARLNVDINLASIRDEGWVPQMRRVADDVPAPEEAQERVMQRVHQVISGGEG